MTLNPRRLRPVPTAAGKDLRIPGDILATGLERQTPAREVTAETCHVITGRLLHAGLELNLALEEPQQGQTALRLHRALTELDVAIRKVRLLALTLDRPGILSDRYTVNRRAQRLHLLEQVIANNPPQHGAVTTLRSRLDAYRANPAHEADHGRRPAGGG
jgi:hypothetical protein